MSGEFEQDTREGLEEKGFNHVAIVDRFIKALPKNMREAFSAFIEEREDQGIGTLIFISPDRRRIVLVPKLGVEEDPMNTYSYSFKRPLKV